jgi:hypothetical protein
MLSNIDPLHVRSVARQIAKACASPSDLKTDVDRLWGCVAAELEAGLIDDDGRKVKNYTVEQGLAAYREWKHGRP